MRQTNFADTVKVFWTGGETAELSAKSSDTVVHDFSTTTKVTFVDVQVATSASKNVALRIELFTNCLYHEGFHGHPTPLPTSTGFDIDTARSAIKGVTGDAAKATVTSEQLVVAGPTAAPMIWYTKAFTLLPVKR